MINIAYWPHVIVPTINTVTIHVLCDTCILLLNILLRHRQHKISKTIQLNDRGTNI